MRPLEIVRVLSKASFLFSKYAGMGLLIIIVGLMFIEVVMRYVFNTPIMWAESLVKAMLVALSFLGSGMALKERAHMRVCMLWDRMPASLRRSLRIVFDVMILVFFVLVILFGYQAAIQTPGFLWEFGNLRKMWLVMIVPVGGVLISVQALYILLEDIFDSGESSS